MLMALHPSTSKSHSQKEKGGARRMKFLRIELDGRRFDLRAEENEVKYRSTEPDFIGKGVRVWVGDEPIQYRAKIVEGD